MRRLLNLVGFVFLCFSTSAEVRYVDLNSASPTPPYSNWSMAATNIQDAIDVCTDGDLVLVTNGIYVEGGRVVYGALTNRVAVTKAIILQSMNGPDVTVIRGYQPPDTTNGTSAVRCVYLTNGATLIGFTLTNGATRSDGDWYFDQEGGGIWCDPATHTHSFTDFSSAKISNCVFAANSAWDAGGGAARGIFNNCVFNRNLAPFGAGVYDAILTNCTVSNNHVNGNNAEGGGASICILDHCLLSGNSSEFTGGAAWASTLNNCVVSNNFAALYGGGVFNPFWFSNTSSNSTFVGNSAGFEGGASAQVDLYNCVIRSNYTTDISGEAGGAEGGTLVNCLVVGNNTATFGGGVGWCDTFNCTIVGNSAGSKGGGAYRSDLRNSIIYNNIGGGNYDTCSLTFCCANPPPTDGAGNIGGPPLFIDEAAGNFRLHTNSPCINSGMNSDVSTPYDLENNMRIAGGTVDIGAYEFASPSSILSYAWLQQYGLPTDGSVDLSDSDSDGFNNWQEWRAKTDPTNALSRLQMLSPSFTNASSGVFVSWRSVVGVNYSLQRSSDLAEFYSLQTNIVATNNVTTYFDSTATNGNAYFYRVGVR